MVIEVAYATPEKQLILELSVLPDSTIESVIRESGILAWFPEIDLSTQAVGIFSRQRQLSDKVQAGDRVEIYRPLVRDPKEARRARAKAAPLRKKHQ